LQHAEAIHSSSASILSQLQANPSAEDIPALQQQLQTQMAQLQQLSGVLQQQQAKEQQPNAVSMLQTSEKKSEEKGVVATEMWIHATRAYADWVVVWACWVWLSTTPAELYLARTSDTVEKFRLTYKKTTVMGIVWGLMLFNWGGFQAELFEMYLIRREAEHAAHAAHGTTNLHAEGGHAEEHGEHGKEHKEEHGKEHKEEHKEEHKQQEHKQQEHKQQEHKEKHASFLQLANEPAHGAEKGGEEKLAVFAKLDLGIRPWNWAAQYFEHVAVNLEFSWISAKLTISLARVAAAHKTKDKHLIEHATDEAVEDWIEFQQIWGMSVALHSQCEMHSYHDFKTLEEAGVKTFKDSVAYGYAPFNGSPLYFFPIRGPFKPVEAIFKKIGSKPAGTKKEH